MEQQYSSFVEDAQIAYPTCDWLIPWSCNSRKLVLSDSRIPGKVLLSPSDHEEGSKGRSSSPQEGDEGKEGIRVSDHWASMDCFNSWPLVLRRACSPVICIWIASVVMAWSEALKVVIFFTWHYRWCAADRTVDSVRTCIGVLSDI